MRVFTVVGAVALVLVLSDAAAAQDGNSIFRSSCATCHAAEARQACNARASMRCDDSRPSRY
jgi:mono/diheme cytochrome c family protein